MGMTKGNWRASRAVNSSRRHFRDNGNGTICRKKRRTKGAKA